MLCLDYLIENSDRHYGNFGFIRDVNSLKFLGPAPLFDNGTSLWCESLNSEIGTELSAIVSFPWSRVRYEEQGGHGVCGKTARWFT